METSSVDAEVVIVGGGICGLATALALHRKNIRSLVLEKSENLRITGVAIIMQGNGWSALEELGIAPKLRQTAVKTHGGRFINLNEVEPKEFPFRYHSESRCIKRIDLMKALADSLPEGTVRTSCDVLSVELHPFTHYPQIMLRDGSLLQAKVVIGCDGINSVVSSMFGLHQSKLLMFSTCVARGFTEYPNDGHPFPSEMVFVHRGQVQLGRLPMTDKRVYWFITRPRTSQDSRISKEAVLMRESAMELMEGYPEEYVEMIRNCTLESLHLTDVKCRAPWELLYNKFRKGTITVAGDAMHATGPFIAQGGAASMEDAIVHARCLAQKMQNSYNGIISMTAAEEAFDEYVKERRMRIFWLSLHSFLIGKKHDTKSSILRFIIGAILAVLFRDLHWHSDYHCGKL